MCKYQTIAENFNLKVSPANLMIDVYANTGKTTASVSVYEQDGI